MALQMGQMPMQPGGPGQMNPMGGGLGFPRLPPGGPATPPMWAPSAIPHPQGAPAQAPAPTGVMPTNPAAGLPTPNVPASVIGDPVPQPTTQPGPSQGFDPPDKGRGGNFEQRWQDRLTQMAQNHPGFLDRMQSMMGRNAGLFGGLERRDPGFDWRSFISGLGTPAAPVGAAATPAAPPATLPAVPAAAAGNAAIFNPLNLPGIGG